MKQNCWEETVSGGHHPPHHQVDMTNTRQQVISEGSDSPQLYSWQSPKPRQKEERRTLII